MEGSHQPHVADGLRAIHAVITRGLEVARNEAAPFQGSAGSDPAAKKGFSDYVGVLAKVANAHHLTEEELAFPYFRDLIPDMPIDELKVDHKRMEPLIAGFADASTRMSQTEDPAAVSAAAADVAQTALEFLEIWDRHIVTEEAYWTRERMAGLVTPEEDARLDRLFAEHDQKLAQPDSMVVPFLLYNLPPERRSVFSDEMPEMVIRELVPVVWKQQWQAMAPYLLV